MTGQEKAQTIAADHPARLGAADQPEAMAAATKVVKYYQHSLKMSIRAYKLIKSKNLE